MRQGRRACVCVKDSHRQSHASAWLTVLSQKDAYQLSQRWRRLPASQRPFHLTLCSVLSENFLKEAGFCVCCQVHFSPFRSHWNPQEQAWGASFHTNERLCGIFKFRLSLWEIRHTRFCGLRGGGKKGVETTFVWKYYEVVTPGLLDKRTLYCRVGLWHYVLSGFVALQLRLR